MSLILVTGATGTVGAEVVNALRLKPVQVRAVVHSTAKAGKLKASNVQLVEADYVKRETLAATFQGVERLFLLTPFVREQVDMGKLLVDLAKKAGVRHIVKLSAVGAEFEPGIQLGRWHREVEKYIEASGIPYTHLRPCSFMQNFIQYFKPQKGSIFLPWGKGKTALIDARDIGAVAAQVLTDNKFLGKALTLTGPQALSGDEVAAILSKATGKPMTYLDMPEDAAFAAMKNIGLPTWAMDALMELHALTKAGFAAGITNTVKQVLGREPIRFEQFAKDHSKLF